MSVRRTSHRLDRNLYKGRIACAFTCCIIGRTQLLVEKNVFEFFQKIFLNLLEKYHCQAHVYLFMPDHFHTLIEGADDQADLWSVIVGFKQKTGFWLSQYRLECWQHDFFDHLLRDMKEIETQVRYILENPIRAGLIEEWKDYQFKGSTVYDLSVL